MVEKGIVWRLGNGQSIRFWHDAWLTNQPLASVVIRPLDSGMSERLFSELWDPGSGWHWVDLLPFLPESLLIRLAIMMVSQEANTPDTISWKLSPTGDYTMASAYRPYSAFVLLWSGILLVFII